MQSVFSRCDFLSAAVSLEHIGILICGKLSANSSKCLQQMGNRITILGSITHPTPRISGVDPLFGLGGGGQKLEKCQIFRAKVAI